MSLVPVKDPSRLALFYKSYAHRIDEKAGEVAGTRVVSFQLYCMDTFRSSSNKLAIGQQIHLMEKMLRNR